MATIDWTSPPIIAAMIAGALAVTGAVVAALIGKGRGSRKQSSLLSRDVQQMQADGNISIGGNEPAPKSGPAKPSP